MRKRIIWKPRAKEAQRLRLFVVRTGVRAGKRMLRLARAARRD